MLKTFTARFIPIVLILTIFVFNASSQQRTWNLHNGNHVPKTVIFKMKEEYRSQCRTTGVDVPALQSYFGSLGGADIHKVFPNHSQPSATKTASGKPPVDLSLIYKITYTGNSSIEKIIASILQSGAVQYAEPKFIPQASYSPNDPQTGLQYFLTNINAYQAWDISKGDTNVVIGITDTGVDWDHPDMVTQVKYNYADPINGIDDDNDGYIDNYRGWDVGQNDNDPMVNASNHGSHVAGCAAAATDNGTGVASPGFNCKLLPVKISNASGALTEAYEGVVYAADHGCDIINCSWGSEGGGQFGQDVVNYATINQDALVVAAAGNSNNENLHFPSAYDNAFSVASTNSSDVKSGFSNYGITIDVCAPGSSIYSTYYNNTYSSQSGTSMASPVCAGAAGIVKSFYPSYNALQVGEQLRVTCDFIDGISGNGAYANKLGRGRIDLYDALTVSSPSVRMVPQIIDNNDNIFVANDTLRIFGDFTNYLAPTTNLGVTITTTSTYVTILDGSTTIGALATMGVHNNSADPFQVKINTNAPVNAIIRFRLDYADGAYTDFQYFDVTVNVDYINVTVNDVHTTITSKGRLGYNLTAQAEGLGFRYMGSDTSMMYEAGLMIGNSSTTVSDNVRGATGTDNDFLSVIRVQKILPTVYSDIDLYGKFNDNNASPQLNVMVTHRAFAWSTPGNTKYVIVEYNIKNNGTALNSLYSGIFTDMDIMDYNQNKAAVDNTLKMGYCWSTQASGLYSGVKLLTTGPFVHYAIDNITGGAGGVNMFDGYDTGEKYTTLSTNRATAGGAGVGNDVCQVVSSGPFAVSTGDSVIVAFALIAGDDLADIQNSAINAQIMYDGMTGVDEQETSLQNVSLFPNPVNDHLNVQFNLSKNSEVEIEIHDLTGKKLLSINEGNLPAGSHRFILDSFLPADGMYFCTIRTEYGSVVKKFSVVK